MAIHGQKPEDALKHALISTVIHTAASVAANKISAAYNKGDLGYITHKITHGLMGGLMGAGLSSALGEDAARGAVAGAIGGVVSEVIVEQISGDVKAIANKILEEAALEGYSLSQEQFKEIYEERTQADLAQKSGKMGAAITSLLAQQNVGISIDTATNAVENNFIPLVIGVGMASWGTYDVAVTWHEEGFEAALIKLGVEIAIGVTGTKIFKLGGKILGPTAVSAFNAYRRGHPIFDKAFTKLSSFMVKNFNKLKTIDALLDRKTLDFYNKAIGSKLPTFGLSKIGTAAALDLAESNVAGINSKNLLNLGKDASSYEFGWIRGVDGKLKGIKNTQIHHIISNKHEATKNHNLWKLAGISPNDPINKIMLPDLVGSTTYKNIRSIHQGRHYDSVNKRLAKEMNDVIELSKNQNWS